MRVRVLALSLLVTLGRKTLTRAICAAQREEQDVFLENDRPWVVLKANRSVESVRPRNSRRDPDHFWRMSQEGISTRHTNLRCDEGSLWGWSRDDQPQVVARNSLYSRWTEEGS